MSQIGRGSRAAARSGRKRWTQTCRNRCTLSAASDPANHDPAVAIAARVTKQPPATFEAWLFTNKDYYRDPNMVPNLVALQANVDEQKTLGFLKGGIDIKGHSDLSLISEAAQRLK